MREVAALPDKRTFDQARLIGRLVATSQYRSGQDVRGGITMLQHLHAQAARQLGPDDPVTLRLQLRALEANVGSMSANEAAEAFEKLAGRCKPAGRDTDRVRAGARMLAAQWQRKAGRVDRGIASYRQELKSREGKLGSESHRTCIARINLSVALTERGDSEDLVEALALTDLEVDLRVQPDRYGPDHAFTWVAMAAKANALLALAERSEDTQERHGLAELAAEITAELVLVRQRRFGRRSESTLRSVRARSRALILLDRNEEASWLLRRVRAVEQAEAALDPGRTSYYLAVALSRTGRAGDRDAARGFAEVALREIVEHTNSESRDARLAADLVSKLVKT